MYGYDRQFQIQLFGSDCDLLRSDQYIESTASVGKLVIAKLAKQSPRAFILIHVGASRFGFDLSHNCAENLGIPITMTLSRVASA